MPLEDHAERVLDLVATIPEGRVLAYGDIAKRLGGMGPRTVGTVMSRYGSDLPWWRVIRSDGRPRSEQDRHRRRCRDLADQRRFRRVVLRSATSSAACADSVGLAPSARRA